MFGSLRNMKTIVKKTVNWFFLELLQWVDPESSGGGRGVRRRERGGRRERGAENFRRPGVSYLRRDEV